MRRISVWLPDPLDEFVDEQVRLRRFGTSSEYICDLIRGDRDRTKLRDLLLEGAAVPPSNEVGGNYFEVLRRKVTERERR